MPAGYTTGSTIKSRLLISSTDLSYDSDIQTAIIEAGAYMDSQARLVGVTINTGSWSDLEYVCADLASGIFKRRHVPDGVRLRNPASPFGGSMEEDYSGYWAQGVHKLNLWLSLWKRPHQTIYVISSSGSGYFYNSGSSGSNP